MCQGGDGWLPSGCSPAAEDLAVGTGAIGQLQGAMVEPSFPGDTRSPTLAYSRAGMRGELGPTPARGEASRDV